MKRPIAMHEPGGPVVAQPGSAAARHAATPATHEGMGSAPDSDPAGTVLLTGAAEYVGARLLGHLHQQGRRVRCLARWPESLHGQTPDDVDVVYGDGCDAAVLDTALDGVDAAFYVAQALGPSGDTAAFNIRAARVFGAAARSAGTRRIVYFSGFGAGRAGDPLASDPERAIGDALRSAGVPVIELHASVLVGPGSLTFEMIRALVERLPLIVAPRWLTAPGRPVALGDLLACLQAALDRPVDRSETLTLGGPEVASYADLMREYARQRGLRRWFVPVAVDAPRASGLALAVVTPVYRRIGRLLIARTPEPAGGDDAAERLAIRTIGAREAIARALRSEDASRGGTLHGVAAARAPRSWGGTRFGNRLVDTRTIATAAAPGAAFAAIERIGGATGWYSARWLWTLRGWMDRAVGGVGMRRGRRDPERLEVGDIVDGWRVTALERGRRLLLAAEMKLPGRGWLEFEVRGGEDGHPVSIRQSALFDPLGVPGLLYWFALWPAHQWVFARMLRSVADAAERSSSAEPRELSAAPG